MKTHARRHLAQTAAVLALFSGLAAASAANRTWTGNAIDGWWTSGANWSPASAPGTGDDLHFAGNTQTTNYNNAGNLSLSSIAFNAGASSFTLHFLENTNVSITGAGISNASANMQTIYLNGKTQVSSSPASLTLWNNAVLGQVNIANRAATIAGGNGGLTIFRNSSSAGTSILENNGGGAAGAYGGQTAFYDNTTAGAATITNYGGAFSSAYGGNTTFFDNATAGNATITTYGGGGSGALGASLTFAGNSTAADATITTSGGAGGSGGGLTSFSGSASGGSARIITNISGTFDISSLATSGLTVGSIEGAGSYILGGKTLTAGSLNTNTTVAGVISGSGGFTKVGTGVTTFTGSNSYTGGTTVKSGTLAVATGGAINHSSADLRISNANGDNGSLLINGGLVSNNAGYIGGVFGSGSTSNGSVTVTSGTWTNSEFLVVGYSGTGNLLINGGLVSNVEGYIGFNSISAGFDSNASGSVTVTSGTWANSSNLHVGLHSSGSVLVNGGFVSSSASIAIGSYPTGSGSVTVTSGTLSSSGLNVGGSGTGSLLVNGGFVTTAIIAVIGQSNNSNGSVTVTSGTWANSGDLVVGHSGTGSLLINGGRVFNSKGDLGYNSTGNGTVTVTGQDSAWINSGGLTVGVSSSNNTLTIEDGALVKVGDANGETIAFSTDGGTNNFLRIDGGYIALFGDQTAYVGELIGDGYIQLWDGAEWITAAAQDVEITYYANDAEGEAAAQEATGYSGLGGYTVATAQAVPEPSTYALIGLGLGAMMLFRRRRS